MRSEIHPLVEAAVASLKFHAGKLLKLPEWDRQTTFVASQMNNMLVLMSELTRLTKEETIGEFMLARTLVEASANLQAGIANKDYAEKKLERVKAKPKPHTRRKSDTVRRPSHNPWDWEGLEKEDIVAIHNIGNSVLHSDPDAGFLLRRAEKKDWTAVAAFQATIPALRALQAFLDERGAGVSEEEGREIVEAVARAWEAALQIKATQSEIVEAQDPFEFRVYNEIAGERTSLPNQLSPDP